MKSFNRLRTTEKADIFLALLLVPVYFAVWGRFGQKFAAGLGLSVLTGMGYWLYAIVSQPAEEELDFAGVPFCWLLFVLFPLFLPLALPLWLIPVILAAGILISISSFGGYGRHFFNPVIIAVVFMYCGYEHTAALGVCRPLASPTAGFAVWTAGMPVAEPVWKIWERVPTAQLLSASISGTLPALPGNAFPAFLLLLSFVMAWFCGRARLWWSCSVVFVMIFSALAAWFRIAVFSPVHLLFLGILPGVLLAAVADYTTIPADRTEQIFSALIFALLTVGFAVHSDMVFGPAFALLLAQIAAPLAADTVMPENAK